MILKYTNYTDGIHDFEFNEDAKTLGLSEPLFGNVNLIVRMDKSHSQIVLNCQMKVNARFDCDRCGEEFTAELKSDFKLVYLFGENPGGSEADNLYYITPDEDKIDLKPDVVEYAQLSIPMKKLCKEDCSGLCPHCGVNLNKETCNCTEEKINPVWAPLLKLKNNSK
ncbi:MAG TPA: DUF177 domain-containing protein [Ignavibacteriales bacterium]|nr:DUF177 domain-containing protein [Ignavibacteriales bacterium]